MGIAISGKTIPECIARHAEQDPDAHCLSIFHRGQWQRVSRSQFQDAVERHASRFSTAFEPGELVLFIKRLDLDALAAYIGAMQAGVLPAMLSPTSSKLSVEEYRRKLEHVLELTRAGGIFADSDAVIAPAAVTFLTPDTPMAESPCTSRSPIPQALVQFSSGSTGLQKGVVLTHQNVIAHMEDYTASIELSAEDTIISWLPLYHDMGLIACYLMPLMSGVPVMLMDPFDWILKPDLLLETIARDRPTLCYLPNFAYHVLVNKGKERDLSSVRLFVNCSEPARDLTHRAFRDKFPSVHPAALAVCYALAENTFAVSQTLPNAPESSRRIADKVVPSCGQVLPRTEVRILEPNEDGVGEIALRGPYLFSHYLGSDLPPEQDFYRTGDLGLLTEDGQLFVTGRKKDLIIANGKNIYPQDVEQVCSIQPGVYPGRAVAFGVTNETAGSEELYVIVERDGSLEDLPLKLAVQKSIENEVGIVPKRVEVVDHMRLVKTSSGKISRSRNKELYLLGELR